MLKYKSVEYKKDDKRVKIMHYSDGDRLASVSNVEGECVRISPTVQSIKHNDEFDVFAVDDTYPLYDEDGVYYGVCLIHYCIDYNGEVLGLGYTNFDMGLINIVLTEEGETTKFQAYNKFKKNLAKEIIEQIKNRSFVYDDAQKKLLLCDQRRKEI